MPQITFLNPEPMGKPLGQYSQITRVKASEFLFIAGQVATNREGKLVGANDFDAQCGQVFANVVTALQSQGASTHRTFPDSWHFGCGSLRVFFQAATIRQIRS